MSIPTREEIKRANRRAVCSACWREQHGACGGAGCECGCRASRALRERETGV